MIGEVKLLSAAARGSGGHGHKLPLGILRSGRKRHFFLQRGSSHRDVSREVGFLPPGGLQDSDVQNDRCPDLAWVTFLL